jgi:hypothetical protein
VIAELHERDTTLGAASARGRFLIRLDNLCFPSAGRLLLLGFIQVFFGATLTQVDLLKAVLTEDFGDV